MTEQQTQSAGGWLDNFVEYVKQAIDIVQLKEEAIDKARADEEAFTMGLIVIALGGVGAAIGSFAPFAILAMPVMSLIGAFVFAAIVHLLATMVFKGDGEFIEFFRPYSLAFVLSWVNVVWILNVILAPLAGIWMLWVSVICVERSYSIDRPQAIATVAIPVVALFILSMMFFAFAVAVAVFLGLSS